MLVRAAVAAGNRRPMILMTGRGDHIVDVRAMEAGAVDYLVKGQFNAQLLERSIRYGIQRKQVETELAEMQQRMADSREEERLYLANYLGRMRKVDSQLPEWSWVSHSACPTLFFGGHNSWRGIISCGRQLGSLTQ
jgi:DNA-binding response OmpR family regulator